MELAPPSLDASPGLGRPPEQLTHRRARPTVVTETLSATQRIAVPLAFQPSPPGVKGNYHPGTRGCQGIELTRCKGPFAFGVGEVTFLAWTARGWRPARELTVAVPVTGR